MEVMGELFVAGTALMFGLSNIFNRRAQDYMSIDNGMMVTLIVNNIIMLIMVLFTLTGKQFVFNMEGFLWFVLAGFFTSFFGRQVLMGSIKINGPSRAGSYKVASPIFTIFIGMLILGESIAAGAMAGVIICLAGLWLISVRDMNNLIKKGRGLEGETKIERRTRYIGILLGLGSGLAFAGGMATRKVGLQLWPEPITGALVGSLAAFIFMWIFLVVRGREIPWRLLTGRSGINYIWSGICSSMAIILFFYAIQYITVTVANVIASLESMFTIGLSMLMLKSAEKINFTLVTGAGLVFIGVTLIFIY